MARIVSHLIRLLFRDCWSNSKVLQNSGCSFVGGGYSEFVWRFPIAFQIIPLLFLFGILWFFPESPRWLVKVGREKEARYVLGRLRGEDDGMAEAEFQDIRNVAEMEKKSGKLQSYFHMFWDVMPKWMGGGSTKHLHIGRRVQLAIWLQILQEWIGIAGVTICKQSPTCSALSLTGPNDVRQMRTTFSVRRVTPPSSRDGLLASTTYFTW